MNDIAQTSIHCSIAVYRPLSGDETRVQVTRDSPYRLRRHRILISYQFTRPNCPQFLLDFVEIRLAAHES